MNEHNHSKRRPQPTDSFWKSRTGIVLIAFLAVAGLLLAYEHRVHVLTGNGVLVVPLALCIGLHLFMHGGHGGHNDSDKNPDRRGRP